MYFFKTNKIRVSNNIFEVEDSNDKIKEEWEKAPMVLKKHPVHTVYENPKHLRYRTNYSYGFDIMYEERKNYIHTLNNTLILTSFKSLPILAQFIFMNKVFIKVNEDTIEDLKRERLTILNDEVYITLWQHNEYGAKYEDRII